MTQYQAEKGAKEVKALQEEEARQKAQLEQLKKDNKELREKIGDEETAIADWAATSSFATSTTFA